MKKLEQPREPNSFGRIGLSATGADDEMSVALRTPDTRTGVARGKGENDSGLTAAIYLRVSTKEQTERDGDPEGYSIPAQREACVRKAAALGATVVDEFVDRGESAKTADRPELQRLLSFVRNEPVRYVIVHKVDRLARNRVDDVAINLALKEAGVQLVSVTENIDDTPSGALLHGIMSSIAEFYSRNLASEVMKGTMQKVQTGGTPALAPIGYLNVRHMVDGREMRSVEVDPIRGPLVTWAFEAYVSGNYTLHQLAEELERRGLTQRSAGRRPERPLAANRLHTLLTNRYYIGIVTYRGIEYEGRHPQLVDPVLFEQAQQVLGRHRNSGERSHRRTHYLKGSLVCNRCGSRLAYCVSRGNGGSYEYFFCLGRHERRTNCDLPHLDPYEIEQAVVRYYSTQALDSQLYEQLRSLLLEDLANVEVDTDKERRRLQAQVTEIQQARRRWAEKSMAGVVPDDIAREQQTLLGKQLTYAQEQLGRLSVVGSEHRAGVEAVLRLARDCGDAYRQSTPTWRHEWNMAFWQGLKIDVDPEARPVVAEGELTPLFQAIRTAKPADLQASDQGKDEPYRRARLFSFCHGSRVATVVEVTGFEPATSTMRT